MFSIQSVETRGKFRLATMRSLICSRRPLRFSSPVTDGPQLDTLFCILKEFYAPWLLQYGLKEPKLRPWRGISIWTTRDSSISGWRSLSIVRIHTAKPQNQSGRSTSLTAKRGRPEIESPRGQFTNHSVLPPASLHLPTSTATHKASCRL